MAKTFLNRESILKAQLQKGEVEVPEWGGFIRFREMTGDELQEMGLRMIGPNGKLDPKRAKDVFPRLVVSCVIDDEGNPLFTDKDLTLLAKQSGGALKKVGEAIQRLSGIGGDDEAGEGLREWLKARYPELLMEFEESLSPVEAAKENFTRTPNGDLFTV